MYLIRLPSGREASFETLQELVAAIQRGDVQRDALIYHRRTDQWLPIQRHPHFQVDEPATAAGGSGAPAAAAAATMTAPPEPPPVTSREAPPDTIPPSPAGVPRRRRQAGPWRGRPALAAAVIILLGGAAGLAIGWKLRPGGTGAGAFRYQPAPAPSSLLRPEPAPAPPVQRSPAPAAARRADPLAPVTAAELAMRREAAFTATRTQLAQELEAVGLPGIFGVRSLSTPEGARASRRIVAAAFNVVGQFHRREIMMDQAYRDTAAFQVTRAGWSREERATWDERSSLREPYASADLAESLLADADSLLAILAANPFSIRGDTLVFADGATAASYRAQRARITERSGPPVGDPDRRPTLAHVQRSVSSLQLPEGAP